MYNVKAQNNHIIFPVMIHAQNQEDREVISIFLHYYRDVGVIRAEGCVLSAIQKASILTGNTEGVIAKILIENGLRASRRSLPQEFLDFIDQMSLKNKEDPFFNLPIFYEDLKAFWIDIGESPFSFISPIASHRINTPCYSRV